MLDGDRDVEKKIDTRPNPYSNVKLRLMRQMNMLPKFKKLALNVQSQSVLSKSRESIRSS